MGYLCMFIAGGMIGVFTMCMMVAAGQADDREYRMLSRLTTCADCQHKDSDCHWCRFLDMPIDENRYCCWAEEERDDAGRSN